jgi:hypothetical protein
LSRLCLSYIYVGLEKNPFSPHDMSRMFFCSDSMVWSRAHASKCEYHERQAATVAVSWAFHEKYLNTIRAREQLLCLF